MDTENPIDKLVVSLPIHYSNRLTPETHLHQFPLLTRPLETPPSAVRTGKRISARIKPNVRRLEIHVPADTRPEVCNADKAKEFGIARAEDDHEKNQESKAKGKEEPRLSEMRLRSEEIPQRGAYMLGIVRDGKLHLHPIAETHQFRPTLTYLDILSRKNKRGGGSDSDSDDGPPLDPDEPAPVVAPKKEKKPAGEAKEIQVSARKADDKLGLSGSGGVSAVRREMLQILRADEDENWENLEFCDVMTGPSGEAYEAIFSQNQEALQCKGTMTSFIDNIQGL